MMFIFNTCGFIVLYNAMQTVHQLACDNANFGRLHCQNAFNNCSHSWVEIGSLVVN